MVHSLAIGNTRKVNVIRVLFMKKIEDELKNALYQELQTLEELDAFYYNLEIIGRETMYRAQGKRVEIEQEKDKLMQNSKAVFFKKPNISYQRPFMFVDGE